MGVAKLKDNAASLREAELDECIERWASHVTEERGFDWSIENWRTEYEYERYQTMCEQYVAGEVELVAVHDAYSRLAKAQRRNHFARMRASEVTRKYASREVPFEDVVMSTDDDNPEIRRARCVTPQWEPPKDFAEEMFRLFDITPEQYINYGK
jgi:hypothetical protein